MTPTEANDAASLVFRLFPGSEWEPEQLQMFIFLAKRKPIDSEQAKAAIVSLSMRHKYDKVKPADVLTALDGATAQVRMEITATDAVTKREKSLARDLNLQTLPVDLRTSALLRIDSVIDRARGPEGELSSLGKNLESAARLAESDWVQALEWSVFRSEVKEHPDVKEWLDKQPLKRLHLVDFSNVSTNG